jgi:SAM-dependent methyltransferase
MAVFNEYSRYYDLLYHDKDYKKEAGYISDSIKKFHPKAKTILELGCGTGKHASLLAEEGFAIHGIDLSKTMLDCAKKLENKNVSFALGDVRDYKISKKFDAVISLFHVASYQTKNDDLLKYFKTANSHLPKNGLFIFDVWYGPAVLNHRPETRVKNLENEFLKIERKATPQIFYDQNIVDVNYEILIINKSDNSKKTLRETHKMRYLFKPELELMLDISGFKLIHVEEWLSKKPASNETWGVCFFVIKKS